MDNKSFIKSDPKYSKTEVTSMNSTKRKWVVITGPTSGIGKEIAIELGALGANLVLACRDVGRGKKIAKYISHNTNSASVAVMHIDTSSHQSIRKCARHYQEKYSRLDVLVNNAGVNRAEQPLQYSIDNIELTFATNVLGYYLLTRELFDLIRVSAPARIINVASSFANDLNLDDLQFEHHPYDGMKAYAQSKACNRMLTWAFARRLEKSGVTINAMAPGLITDTNLFSKMSSKTKLMLHRKKECSVAQGADTAIWLASSPDVEGVSGKFFKKRKEISCKFRNIADEEKLWGICEKLVKQVD